MAHAVLYRRKPGVFRIEGTPGFLLLSLGQIVSLIGSGMTCFAQSIWIYTDLGGSITNLTAIAVLAQLPGVIISPIAGVLVDRWDRRWVMIVSNAVAALATLALRTLIVTHTFQIWHIYVIVIVLSIANHFQWPAFFATIPLVVPKQHLGSANGLVQTARALGQIAAPFMAGVVVTLFKIQGVILFDMISYLVAFVTLLIVRIPRPPLTDTARLIQGSLKRELVYGWKYLVDRPGLLGLLLLFSASSFLIGVVSLLLMPMALSTISATTYGALASIGGISMILSGLMVSVWGVPKRRVYAVLGLMVVQGVAIMLGGLRPSVGLYLGASVVFYFAVPVIGACSEVIWQSKTALDVQGRVLAASWMASVAATQLGFLIAGPLADYVFEPLLAVGGPLAGSVGLLIGTGRGRGIGFMFIIFGALYIVVTAMGYLSSRLRRVDEELPDAIGNVPVSTRMAMRTIGTVLMRE
jgi:MFS family permease